MSNKQSNAAVAHQSGDASQSPWADVYAAVGLRWPQIDQGDLRQCEQSVAAITGFVSQQVGESREEVESAVSEFAPVDPGMLDPLTDRLKGFSDNVAESAHSAVERVQYEIDESPVKLSLGAMAFGFALGVLATTAYVRAHQEATAWDRVRGRFGA
ncbi:hypothetical protein K227x_04060 [Rubripirellula lacrimiformis]|uniref:Uncharacterized protein n=1 Tax=Rubripirellula lacrimiformis TaxID=1930273 RepID=A0A517N4H5_9BACT|nr:hypothetical protein [Rubripirellula lacrimiformis]QDT02035.1 hypothetical protein K227x_04060 [Rubripirellula lacrimiformis]